MLKSDATLRARQLGAELRRSRREAGLGAEHVADKLGVSMSKISRLETGSCGPKLEDVAGMLALYGVTGHARAQLLELCREIAAGERGWWQRREMSHKQRTLIELESEATRIINYESLLIPGLLQTGEYTRALLQGMGVVPENEIEDRMVTRLLRQSVLRKERAPQLVAIIYEAALRQHVGGPDVMRRQFEYLVHAAAWPHVTIRVVPFSNGVHSGLDGPFAKLEFASAPSVLYIANLTSSLFLEEREDIDVHNRAIKGLSKAALDAGESAKLIAGLAIELDRPPSA
ncbi:helix-turn-helix domain-containing protein [Saccharopolyspora erythraea]|uniref:helix-turn-helix domain-containing protein n=1 Tax=Saccharopolyspora erythraea TaxID=1836 RepID=UPI001BA9D93D|nr:helix-turn-helix transcriptional regulator [Saccharopolyspora erythraea]QUH04377.1 helix-turn-helix domain-containing protein [Saccharopolyspora erythraea]